MLLRRALPSLLINPTPMYDDRQAHHDEVAIILRQNQNAKRKQTQEKRKATMARKARDQVVYAGEASIDMLEEAMDVEEGDGIQIDNPRKRPRNR